MTGNGDLVLGEGEHLAEGDSELHLDEVDERDELGGRVLDLEAGVHLEEEEPAVLVEELGGAGVDVAATLRDLDGGLAHGGKGGRVDVGRRCFLDELLVAALGRAVACAEVDAVAVLVG
ncbi:unannotated protein [freshwater metagenome]|uniref:Unannotated protein n=1 Tax=freshwater metagenome TaxID=449393 RepID=A0A6J6VQE5_9ZZZZ